ncbi:MAG: type II toxin-antitoxin system VapC family toxin [Gammaproteobacteria bacterium]|nr:type II toxin-antitoxin system VapC family toxin [Gammaproteobacteria bacterium]
MIVDTSALLAILQAEPENQLLAEAIEAVSRPTISVVSFVEASIVLDARHGAEGRDRLDRVIRESRMEIAPVDLEQAQIAREAFRDFGKGRHPARLNFGDCFVYALARQRGEPLLFKGDDFTRTDIRAAVTP